MRALAGGSTVGDFAALSGVGLDPVGQVSGSAVIELGPAVYDCSHGMLTLDRWSGKGATPALAKKHVPDLGRHLRGCFEVVERRLLEHCASLGGHGVVGMRLEHGLSWDWAPGGESFLLSKGVLDLRLTGTAVRIRDVKGPRTFTSAQPAGDVAVGIRSGLFPYRTVWGTGVAMAHGFAGSKGAQNGTWGGRPARSAELPSLTKLCDEARQRCHDDAIDRGAGATPEKGLVLVGQAHLQTWETEPFAGHRHVFALATVLASGFARVGEVEDFEPLAVMPLDGRRSRLRASIQGTDDGEVPPDEGQEEA